MIKAEYTVRKITPAMVITRIYLLIKETHWPNPQGFSSLPPVSSDQIWSQSSIKLNRFINDFDNGRYKIQGDDDRKCLCGTDNGAESFDNDYNTVADESSKRFSHATNESANQDQYIVRMTRLGMEIVSQV